MIDILTWQYAAESAVKQRLIDALIEAWGDIEDEVFKKPHRFNAGADKGCDRRK